MDTGSIADTAIHGRGEGMFMKSLNCGCVVSLVIVGLMVLIIMLATTSR